MARKKTTLAVDIIDIVALLPWWGGVALAVVAYLVLHAVAAPSAPVAVTGPGQVGSIVVEGLVTSVAGFLQYALPFLFLIAAAVSFARQRRRTQLVENVTGSKSADALSAMTWLEFEALVGEAFRIDGYTVKETGGRGPDGGVDLVMTKDGEKYLVQCKQWRAFKVGVDVVRELFGVMAAVGATGGFVVTSGRFTQEATNFAAGRNVSLIDGHRLHEMIRRARGPAKLGLEETRITSEQDAPMCPLCSKAMVQRVARKGAQAGGSFWGCTGYPACRGTRPLNP